MNWELEHKKRIEANAKKVMAIYENAAQEAAQIGATVTKFNPDKPFSFDDYPWTKYRINKLISSVNSQLKTTIVNGSTVEWEESNFKNNELAKGILGFKEIPKGEKMTPAISKYFNNNEGARDAFIARKDGKGLTLSDRVWKYSNQFKTEIEMGLDDSIRNGHPAAKTAREIRQFLVEPDRFYRRFQMNLKDAKGNNVLDSEGKKITFKQERRRYVDPITGAVTWKVEANKYKPGQGVYKSSVKNSQRLTRHENNMAYRTADHTRMQQFNFIVGQEVKLSKSHIVYDICDHLKGKYPKEFVYNGWHTQCFCFVEFILKTPEELQIETEQILNGDEPTTQSENLVTAPPDGFNKWIKDNEERVKKAQNTPYFIADNFINGDITKGLSYSSVQAEKAAKDAVIAKQQNDIIQAAIKKEAEKALALKEAKKAKDLAIKKEKELADQQAAAALKLEQEAIALKKAEEEALALKKAQEDAIKAEQEALAKKKEHEEELKLGTLLVDVKGLKAQFGKEGVQDLYNAVEAKLATWEELPLHQQKKKLLFEITFVEDKKKYSTWKGAQDAYKKKLSAIDYIIDKEDIQISVSEALKFSLSTKSSVVKQLANEVSMLLGEDAPIATINAKVKVLNEKVNKLISASEAKKAKGKIVKLGDIDEDRYSQQRKDKALWSKTAKTADKQVRPVCETAWQAASSEERDAAYRYTAGSSYINEPLRKMQYSGQYAGVYNGKVDAENLAKIIDRSSYDFDMWVQRGVGSEGVQGIFGIDLYGKSIADVRNDLLGKIGTEPAFSSCGNTKGSGFSDKTVTYNIYCPSGTKMLYSEPFSAFGSGHKRSWDGKEKQSSFGYEAEMLLQKGSQFRVTKVEKTGSRWFIDMEVVAQ